MEVKMINEQIKYFIEKNELLKPYQSGFRKGRSLIDPAVEREPGFP